MKITTIIYIIFAVVAALGLFIIDLQHKEIASLRGDNSALVGNNNLLIGKLRSSYNDQVELAKSNELLKKAIKADKSGFDWNYDLSANPVLIEFKRMHQN